VRAGLSLLLFLALLAGCDEDAARPRAEDPWSAFSFALLQEAPAESQDRRSAWRMPSGVTVTAQRMAVSDSLVRERSVSGVATALVRRFDLGEVDGALAQRRCAVNGIEAVCTTGWMVAPPERGGGQWARRGVLLEIGSEIVFLEVLGPEELGEQVDDQADLLRRTLEVRG